MIKISIPNLITIIRIFFIPIVIFVFYFPSKFSSIFSSLIFSVLCLTDLLDGYLARYMNQVTKFGAFLDPVADKLITLIAMILIIDKFHKQYIIIPLLIIIGRDIVISAIREWMSEIGKRYLIAVNYIAKIKTAIEMVSLAILLLYNQTYLYSDKLLFLGIILLYMSMTMALFSMYMYIKTAWPYLTNQN